MQKLTPICDRKIFPEEGCLENFTFSVVKDSELELKQQPASIVAILPAKGTTVILILVLPNATASTAVHRQTHTKKSPP